MAGALRGQLEQAVRTGLRTYVDDIRKWARGTAEEVADTLAASIGRLKTRLEADGMKLQLTKCVAVATGRRHRTALVRRLGDQGIKVVDHAKDLGADSAPSSRRVHVQRGRRVKATARLKRTGRLPDKPGVRAHRARAYALSVATYAVEVQGMGVTAQVKLRAAVAAAIRPAAPARGCPMTLLALKGTRADPVVEVPSQVIGHWARRAWTGALPAGLGAWWETHGATRADRATDMARVRGPIGALVQHSLQVGWRVLSPWAVQDERGGTIDLREEAPQSVEARAREAARDAAWRQSISTRQDAVGLEQGGVPLRGQAGSSCHSQ